MKQLFIFVVIFICLISGATQVYANTYDEAYAERLKAAKNHARARILVAGLKRKKTIRESIFLTAIKGVEKHVLAATDHVSKSREYLLKGYHNGDIDEVSEKKLREILKRQKLEIAELRSSIDGLYSRHADKKNKAKVKTKVKTLDKGPEREKVVSDFLDWLDFVTQLKKKESVKWKNSASTKQIWDRVSGDSGFYGIHISSLGDSVIYADNREKTSQQDYDYVRDGMRRFMKFHDRFIELLGKVQAAHNADLKDEQRKAERFIRPYLSQKVFSGLPKRDVFPAVPNNPIEDIGYIPSLPMMQAFSDLPKNPSLLWIKRDENVKQVIRAFYDRGFAHEFLKKFVSLGGRFTVEITDDSNDEEVSYFPFDGTLYIPKSKYIDGRLNIDSELLVDLFHVLFQAYGNKVIDANMDPLTKNLLTNIEIWLAEQFIRKRNNDGSSGVWVKFSDNIKDTKGFTEDYVGKIIRVAFSSHLSIWDNLYHESRVSRITQKKAATDWRRAESKIINTEYAANQTDDSVSWEVQTVPPDFVTTYIIAFYGFGEFQ